MVFPSVRLLFANSCYRFGRHVSSSSSSSFYATEALDPPPVVQARRVVVTGNTFVIQFIIHQTRS